MLQLGTKEITNLDFSQNIDFLKKKVQLSSESIFNLAEQSLKENSELKSVVIVKRIFRCDSNADDPTQIKKKLSDFDNRELEDL